MSEPKPPAEQRFDVAVEPAPKSNVLEAEEDDDSKRARDAALVSTFDPALAHHGKTDEELIEERQDATRVLGDAVIVAGIAIALAENAENDALNVEEDIADENPDDGGE